MVELSSTRSQDAADQSLRGQRVVIVGGTSGMGLGAVHAALDAGAEVIMAGRRAEAARKVIDAHQLLLKHRVVDVTDEVAVREMFEHLGELDHLFVTAAPPPGSWGRLLEQDVAGAQESGEEFFEQGQVHGSFPRSSRGNLQAGVSAP